MMRRWLVDAADRLEAAAELAGELRRTRGLGLEAIRIRMDFLAERLWEIARRVGILQTLGTGARAQLAHSLCDLYRVARRAHHLALAEGVGTLGEDLEAIASELHALVAELEAAGWVCDSPAIPPAGAPPVLPLPAAPAEDASSRAPREGVLRRSRPSSAIEAPIARGREDALASEVAINETAAGPAAGGCR